MCLRYSECRENDEMIEELVDGEESLPVDEATRRRN